MTTYAFKSKLTTLYCCGTCLNILRILYMLMELRKLIKPNRLIVVTVPSKLRTFDYARPYTSFEHLLSDYINNVDEDD